MMAERPAWRRERRRAISRMKGLLKFITCGSVDDGKSTLIGHILYDSKLLYADQEKALLLDSKVGSRGGEIDYSLLLDGLMAEREQGITIDVAYRYFTTDNRSFIVADTPGHEEYTRNMAVGASFADLAVILIDAKQGVLVQTRRHARICALMGIKFFVFAINKMDLVGYSRERFEEISEQVQELSRELNLHSVKLIPVSATEGDNVTVRSTNTSWYEGPALLEYLEQIDVEDTVVESGFYLPVQRVCRPDHTFRGFQGQIESGKISVGDEIVALPGKEKAHVKSLIVAGNNQNTATVGQPVTLQLDREIDVSRGSVLERESGVKIASSVTATILWMDDTDLQKGRNFLVKLGTKTIPAILTDIIYSINVNTGEEQVTNSLSKNEIASVNISFADRIVVDIFKEHKTLGELILIDRVTNMTSACGIVTGISEAESDDTVLTPDKRAALIGHKSAVVEVALQEPDLTYDKARAVELRLLSDSKHAYLYQNIDTATDIKVLRALQQAGVIVLYVVAKGTDTTEIRNSIGSENYYNKWSALTGTDIESIYEYVRKISSNTESISRNADYI
jgi:sulfate adenylyltransferase subunit 1